MTGSPPAIEELLRLEQRHLDVAANLEDGQIFGESAVHPDEAELALAGLERQADVADLHGAGAVQHPRPDAKDALHCEHEVGRAVDDVLHRSRSGTVSKPMA